MAADMNFVTHQIKLTTLYEAATQFYAEAVRTRKALLGHGQQLNNNRYKLLLASSMSLRDTTMQKAHAYSNYIIIHT